MSVRQYMKDKIPAFLLNLLGLTVLALFLVAAGISVQASALIVLIWAAVIFCYLTVSAFRHRNRLKKLMTMAEELEEKYLLPEIMAVPEKADERAFYQILKISEKSMLEKIDEVQRERKEYREYIEQWIHEVKTPIAAMKLICENNPAEFTRELLIEIESISRFTEQALYYARSEYTEKDYSVRVIRLGDVIHDAIADNKYLLRKNGVKIRVEDAGQSVRTDDKWIRFILDQIIVNAVKYRSEHPVLNFSVSQEKDRIILTVEDNGIGIPEGDLPRIFDKGFTGRNGRRISGSTGIGLYLCRRLCVKLGIGLTVRSQGRGTAVSILFPLNDFITEIQTEVQS